MYGLEILRSVIDLADLIQLSASMHSCLDPAKIGSLRDYSPIGFNILFIISILRVVSTSRDIFNVNRMSAETRL